ncbi:hypothetical protein HII31_01532 [Pseudocercospora fuligena]|uniref:Uncharacterized protein n=1 Tax=Pseudocercospora fuligena TaxID=685502 RepID=A0A8H6RUG9_9PEZI|nr:hypothetical protein HII31_01532 [Pseudocercospora fuligena]
MSNSTSIWFAFYGAAKAHPDCGRCMPWFIMLGMPPPIILFGCSMSTAARKVTRAVGDGAARQFAAVQHSPIDETLRPRGRCPNNGSVDVDVAVAVSYRNNNVVLPPSQVELPVWVTVELDPLYCSVWMCASLSPCSFSDQNKFHSANQCGSN